MTSGVTSQALWDSLNIALLMYVGAPSLARFHSFSFRRMHRNDLAAMCGQRDLAGIKLSMPSVEEL